jgi:hypothetical protein
LWVENIDMNVADLQRALIRHGFSPGRIDGLIGPNTARAIRSFQASRGLAQTGMPNPATREALLQPVRTSVAAVPQVPATHIAAAPERACSPMSKVPPSPAQPQIVVLLLPRASIAAFMPEAACPVNRFPANSFTADR